MSGADQHDDLLRRASAALRDQTEGNAARAGATRARLLESAARRSLSQRSRWLRWLLGTGSLFVVGTALARVPDYAPRLLAVLRPAPVVQEAAARRARRGASIKRVSPVLVQAGAAAVSPASESATPVTTAAVELAPSAPIVGAPVVPPSAGLPVAPAARSDAPAHATRPTARRAAGRAPNAAGARATPAAVRSHEPPAAVVATAPGSSSPAIAAAELELFRRAEHLHRVSDPSELAAWDAYLRLADHGVLVPEARYNRALCLVRLGRKGAAQEALAPFARGVYGGYRRQEAEALLVALGSRR